MSAEALDDHLVRCPDCAQWVDRAILLNRSTRIGQARVPDLAEAILAAAPLPSRRRALPLAVPALRIALGAIAVAQLAISVPSLVGDDMAMPMEMHASHESAAFNIALGVGFLAVAMMPRRAGAALPIAGTFVAILSVLSIVDVVGGAVGVGRLATHLTALAGVAAMVGLSAIAPATGDPSGSRAGGGRSGGRRLDAGPAERDGGDEQPGRLRGVA